MRQALLAIYTVLWYCSSVSAQQMDPNELGLSIAKQVDQKTHGYGDLTASLVMVLKDSRGQTSYRRMRIQTLEIPGNGERSLCIFEEPADVKDTALLTHAHRQSEDDQWLYLPALRRVKRIAGASKASSFVGSEFSYEDIAGQQLEKYTYRYLGQELLDGNDCYVIERIPIDRRNCGYSRQKAWIDKAEYRILKVDYYDRRGALHKTLTMHGYRRYLDKFWRPDRMVMVNHQSGKSTELIWSKYRFQVGLRPEDFSTNVLLRLR